MARLASGHPDAPSVLGRALLESGDAESAILVFEEDLARKGRRPVQLSNLALAYYRNGQAEAGNALLAELEARAERHYLPSVPIATLYAEAGHLDEAYRRLEIAVEQRERGAIFLRVDPVFDLLADRPDYRQLLERIEAPTR